jgi:hypothetical protein
MYASVLLFVVTVWSALKYNSSFYSVPTVWFIDVFPWYMLIIFGCFCLAKLGYDLLSFNDYPLEIKKLEEVSLTISLFPPEVLSKPYFVHFLLIHFI